MTMIYDRLSNTRKVMAGAYSQRAVSNVKLREFTFFSNFNFCPGVPEKFMIKESFEIGLQ